MTVTISDGTATLTPLAYGLFRSRRRGGTVIHETLGREFPDYSLRAAGSRNGTFRVWFESEADSAEAEALLSAASTFTLTISDFSSVGMTFVVPESGEIERFQDPQNPDLWALDVIFREVTP